jgi:DNA-binding XRE family transcriptional regulator
MIHPNLFVSAGRTMRLSLYKEFVAVFLVLLDEAFEAMAIYEAAACCCNCRTNGAGIQVKKRTRGVCHLHCRASICWDAVPEYKVKRDLAAGLLKSVRQMKAGQVRAVTSSVLKVRNKTGLSQSEFTALLGVSVRTLQGWEQGRKQPSGAA